MTPRLRIWAPRAHSVEVLVGVIVERGDVSLVCNLGAAPVRAELYDVLLASTGLSSSSELPPVSCALTRMR